MGCSEKESGSNHKSEGSYGTLLGYTLGFANKGINAINISNILNRKEVVKEIPPYFKNQSVPIVSYKIVRM
jgi:hypothetical protein